MKKKQVRNYLILLLSVLMLASGTGCVYADNLLNRINFIPDDPASSKVVTGSLFKAGTQSTASTEKSGVLSGLFHDDAITNILLLGTDDYHADDVGRSDSMMLVSVDTRHKKLKIISMASYSLTYLKYPLSQDRIPGDNEFHSETIAGAGDSLVPDLPCFTGYQDRP